MRESVSPSIRVKAAGGVRTLDAMLEVLGAGAVRVGATATRAILDEFVKRVGEEINYITTPLLLQNYF
jgi:deoxyribose-phosphate aldolase